MTRICTGPRPAVTGQGPGRDQLKQFKRVSTLALYIKWGARRGHAKNVHLSVPFLLLFFVWALFEHIFQVGLGSSLSRLVLSFRPLSTAVSYQKKKQQQQIILIKTKK